MDFYQQNEHHEFEEHHEHEGQNGHEEHNEHRNWIRRHHKTVIAIVNNNLERKENDELEKIQHSANALALNNSFNNHIEQKNGFESEDD